MSYDEKTGPGQSQTYVPPKRGEHDLARLTAAQIGELPKERAVVVQPIGSMEQHGAHLPVFTDAYIAESLVRGSVALLGEQDPPVWVLPTISYGRSVEHLGSAGTVSLSSETLFALCRDLGRSIAASGFRRLAFVNGHGGNLALLDVVARDIRAETGLYVFRVMPGQFPLPEGITAGDEDFAAHADFVETSMMLAFDPSLVHMDRAEAGGRGAERLFAKSYPHLLGGYVATAWLTRDLSSNGVIGDPTAATAEAGRRIVESFQRKLVDCYREMAGHEFDSTR